MDKRLRTYVRAVISLLTIIEDQVKDHAIPFSDTLSVEFLVCKMSILQQGLANTHIEG